jgi:hypothetical protein
MTVLLGSYSSPYTDLIGSFLGLSPMGAWKSPSSPFALDDHTILDFTSILAGAIAGRIDITIEGSSITIDNLSTLDIAPWHSDAPNSRSSSPIWTTTTSVQIIPEPGTIGVCLLLPASALMRTRRVSNKNANSRRRAF